ncbi:hypothetical protein KSP40_PGU003881 [Platanthera guangdongensis]|uniref:Uncharacterized protein n=1 Tax=Platanthera guangdongensis TaxID=2320717 RepID=A0ABR2LEW4_9ASPA
MVCKVEDCGKPRGQEVLAKNSRNKQKETNKTPRQQPASLLCNKGIACKFKLSFFGEDDAISSAILLLALLFSPPELHLCLVSFIAGAFLVYFNGGWLTFH